MSLGARCLTLTGSYGNCRVVLVFSETISFLDGKKLLSFPYAMYAKKAKFAKMVSEIVFIM